MSRPGASRGVSAWSLLCAALSACSDDTPRPSNAPQATASAALVFRDVTAASGIDFVHHNGATPQRVLLEVMGGGVAVIDYDGDGRQDLYFVDSGAVPTKSDVQASGSSRLYRNLGGMCFEDVTAKAGVAGRGYGMGAVVGDYDNDGDQDLYVTNYGSNILYRNNGDGTFSDVTRAAGCDDTRWSTGAAFLDFDRDGHLDLFVQNYLDLRVETQRPYVQRSLPSYPPPEIFDPVPNALFHNRGDGTFENVSQVSNIGASRGKGLGTLVADFDDDGDSDIYCANDTAANFLFENLGGGRFQEVGLASGAAYSEDGRENSGMGVDASDFDGDGRLDILVANFWAEADALYRGEGGLYFTEISSRSGIAEATRRTLGFGARFLDYDRDGVQDIALANGHVYDNAPALELGPARQVQQLFHGLGAARFEDVAPAAAPDFARERFGRGLCVADFDDDGDLDLVITTLGARPALYENVCANSNAWTLVRAIGTRRDSTAIGARVTVECGGKTQFNFVRSGASYLSQSDLRLFFGLGGAEVIERISVRWPDGTIDEQRDVPARHQIAIVEGRGMQLR